MDILKRKFRGEKREFPVYSQSEADEAGIEYVHWKQAQVGDWALSDDGHVGECLAIMGPYTNQRGMESRFMIFSYAKTFNYSSTKLNFMDHKVTNSYGTISTKDWATVEANSGRGKRFINAYVMNFMAGVTIDWEKLGLIYRPDQAGKEPGRTAKHIFSQEAFREMIQQKMIEVFKGKNISEPDVIEMFRDALVMAKANKDAKEMRMIAEDFRDMLDMNPKELPRGREIPYDEADVVDELQGDIDQAQIELGQKRIAAGETKEE